MIFGLVVKCFAAFVEPFSAAHFPIIFGSLLRGIRIVFPTRNLLSDMDCSALAISLLAASTSFLEITEVPVPKLSLTLKKLEQRHGLRRAGCVN